MNLFFDNQYTLIKKNFGGVLNRETSIVIILDKGAVVNLQKEKECKEWVGIRSNIFEVASYKELSKLIHELSEVSDKAFVGAYRMIDAVVLRLCNELGIKTALYQHGMENSVQIYSPKRIYDKFNKIIFYAKFLHDFCAKREYNSIYQIARYLKYLRRNGRINGFFQLSSRNHPTMVYTYSEFYLRFWRNKWDFSVSEVIFVEFQDIYREYVGTTTKDMYILQTFVEDGRTTISEYLTYLDNLSPENVEILAHPRSSNEVLAELVDRGFVISYDLKVARAYIGCSSSLLVGIAACGHRVYHLPFVKNTPSFISECEFIEYDKKAYIEKEVSLLSKSKARSISGYGNKRFEEVI